MRINSRRKKVVVTGDFELPSDFSEKFDITHIRKPIDEFEISAVLSDCWGYVLGGPEFLSAALLHSAKKLQYLVVMGTGTSSFVDESTAIRLGITVFNTPALNSDAVVEFTQSVLTAVSANLFHSIDLLEKGLTWYQTPRLAISDARIAIIGMGTIGKKMVARLKQIGCNQLSYYSRTRDHEFENKFGVVFKPLPLLLEEAEILCAHVTYSEDTHHLISHQLLKSANPDLKIVNMSNPRIIDPKALRDFLILNRNSSCFLDGYYEEWANNAGAEADPHSLLKLGKRKFVASSHIAAQEAKTVGRLVDRALEILIIQESI